MYKAGHDSLGEEMMGILTDKENVSRKLLRVAMLRLGKHLSLIVLEDSVNVLLSLVIGYEYFWDAGAGGCSLRRSSKFLSFFSNSVSLSEAAQSF